MFANIILIIWFSVPILPASIRVIFFVFSVKIPYKNTYYFSFSSPCINFLVLPKNFSIHFTATIFPSHLGHPGA